MEKKKYSHIRTYVHRQTRLTSGQRHALDKLFPLYSVDISKKRPVMQLFPHSFDRYVLEIGFGMGDATLFIAEHNPDTAYLGIEVHPNGVGRVVGSIHKKGLDNLRVIKEDAIVALSEGIETQAFDGVHIFFPDPWPKKRHHKRRLIQRSFLDFIADYIKSEGYLYVVTDWHNYALQILNECSSHPAFYNPWGGFAPRQVWRPVTKYESKGHKQHHPIWETYVIKR
ncbi:tRNA (guanosine(46)-N7)-methyltransferase TrmB [Spirochaetia bacterium 38H-sp]|uniref:tRNA (guanine-N(7)-)-methyltransferase n=1 Tax=Rarispira pelagica TaxID=3141764 RepID=A0ABU9UDC8_9SPIR